MFTSSFGSAPWLPHPIPCICTILPTRRLQDPRGSRILEAPGSLRLQEPALKASMSCSCELLAGLAALEAAGARLRDGWRFLIADPLPPWMGVEGVGGP